jgi:hypothetical protein
MTDLKAALALCEAATEGEWIARDGIVFSDAHPFDHENQTRDAVAYYRDEFRAAGHLLHNNADGAFIAAARTLLPEALDEIERLRAEVTAWRAKQPLLDKLADLLGLCEGVCPLRAAVTEIERLRTWRQSIEDLKARTRRNQEEVDRWLTDP